MKINYITGDATDPPTELRPAVIVHIVNDAGKWGKGFVLAVSARWPDAKHRYQSWAANNGDDADAPFALGAVQFVSVEPDLTIANLVGQQGTARRGGKPPIRYEAVRTGLQTVRVRAKENNGHVCMPRIGCGLAGGNWEIVRGIIAEELTDFDVPVTVFDLPGTTKN